MSTSNEDFWPSDLAEDIPNSPKDIMQIQAAKLGEKTKNVVVAEIDTRVASNGEFIHKFIIRAPALGNYKYELFTIYHTIALYPVHDETMWPYENEYLFKEFLKDKLTADETVQIVKALISQSKGRKPEEDIPF